MWLSFFCTTYALAPQRDAVGHPGALEVVPQLPFLELAHVELVELLVRELGEGGDLREIVRGRGYRPEPGRGSTHVRDARGHELGLVLRQVQLL